jgi:hypothetical protein
MCTVYFDAYTTLSRYSDGLQAGRPGFDSRQGQVIFLDSTASRRALELVQPPIQRVPGDLLPEVKQQEREADHSPPSSDEVKKSGVIPPFSHQTSCLVLN